jgi:uridine kinase
MTDFVDLAKQVLDRPARLGPVRLVVVDGPCGAGKTTFAERLAEAVTAEGATGEVVHSDDLVAGWDDQFGFGDRLDRLVLAPLRAALPGRYPVYDWVRGRFARERTVPVPDVLIVEGSTATGAAPRAELTLSVFLDAPEQDRLARVLARDGAGIEAPLRRWMAAERAWFAARRPWEWVDLRMDAAAGGGAPSREDVQLLGPGDGHG